jgi:DNA-binding CsgD family transcriptional regulator
VSVAFEFNRFERALASRMPDSGLSSREQEVLRRLVDGLSNREIANLLGITEATVQCHVSTILMRLNVSHRTQAVVTALQRDWSTYSLRDLPQSEILRRHLNDDLPNRDRSSRRRRRNVAHVDNVSR